jgi:hypothetical protein
MAHRCLPQFQVSWQLVLALPLTLSSRLAFAESRTPVDAQHFHLTWQAASECPQGEAVADRIRSLLTREPSLLAPALDAKARLSELPSGEFRLDLELIENNERRQRTVQAKTCEEVAEAGALIIALAIDPQLGRESLEHPVRDDSTGSSPRPRAAGATEIASQQPEPRPIRARPQDAHEPPEPSTTAKLPGLQRSGQFGVGLAALLDSGSLPDLALGAEANLRSRWQPLELQLGGAWLPPHREPSTANPTTGGYVQLLTFDARGCWLRAIQRSIGVGGCLVVELGRRHAEAFGAVRNGTGNTPWIAPGAGFLFSYRLRRELSWRARLDGLVPLDRAEFIVENVGSLPAPRWLLRFSLGIDADFW